MKAKKPHWSLEDAKRLAAEGRLFLSKTKAQAFFPDPWTAATKAQAVIADLTERQFAHTLQQTDICDVYGVRLDGKGWYVKLTIDDLLVIVSLHPLEKPLKTNAGEVKP